MAALPADPVRLYAEDDQRLPRTLAGRLRKHRADLAQQLVDGYAQDWADYKHRTGVLRGLDEAIQMCEQANEELTR